jgi:hypothetical protein
MQCKSDYIYMRQRETKEHVAKNGARRGQRNEEDLGRD